MASFDKIWEKICDRPFRSDITMFELDKILVGFGFELVRHNASHRHYKHSKIKDLFTIPAHSDKSCVLPVYVKKTHEFVIKYELNEF